MNVVYVGDLPTGQCCPEVNSWRPETVTRNGDGFEAQRGTAVRICLGRRCYFVERHRSIGEQGFLCAGRSREIRVMTNFGLGTS